MSNAPRLSKSGIEYLDYMWSPYSGCLNWKTGVCGDGGRDFNCWAMGLTKRFKAHYPNGFEPTLYPEALMSPMSLKKPSVIGVAWVGDLFLDAVDPGMKVPVCLYGDLSKSTFVDLLKSSINPVPGFPLREALFTTIKLCPRHTFVFLTKCPWNLIKWSPFPDNCRVGVTATNREQFTLACAHLIGIQATVKFISLEPLLQRIPLPEFGEWGKEPFDWLAIGAQTRPFKPPELEWVYEIVQAADKAGIPVFLKENLNSIIPYTTLFRTEDRKLRQEMPEEVKVCHC